MIRWSVFQISFAYPEVSFVALSCCFLSLGGECYGSRLQSKAGWLTMAAFCVAFNQHVLENESGVIFALTKSSYFRCLYQQQVCAVERKAVLI